MHKLSCMERISEKPPRNISIKRTLILFFANVIAMYIVSMLGLGVEIEYLDDILLFVADYHQIIPSFHIADLRICHIHTECFYNRVFCADVLY